MKNRREFLKSTGIILGAGLSLPVMSSFISSCDKNEGPLVNQGATLVVKLSDYPILDSLGNSVKVTSTSFNDGASIIITRTSVNDFLVFSSKCTHEGCEVDLPSSGEILCGCHGSIFSATDGSVKQKPMDNADIKPLPKYKAIYDSGNNIITITS
jgi:Rieske Fe-S protein